MSKPTRMLADAWKPLVVVAIFVLAGCTGSSSDFDALDPEAEPGDPVEVEPGLVVTTTTGAVRGKVIDDAGLAVPQARASLVGTNHFADTNQSGGFLFVNVSAGDHRLVVQASNFRPYESTVAVEPANVTSVEVILIPAESRGAGYRPHVHDFWGERTEHVMMDEPVDLTHPGSNQLVPIYEQLRMMFYYPNIGSDIQIFPPDLADGTPNLVYPGTAEMQVTLRWEETDTTLDEVAFSYRSRASGDVVELEPHPSAETWFIPVTQEMADTGHQQASLWEFWIEWPNSVTGDTNNWEPGANLGEIDVHILIVKGETIPPEPPHPNFWEDNDTIELPLMEMSYQYETGRHVPQSSHFVPPSESIVPPGTATMRMVFTWQTSGATSGTQLEDEFTLLWRPANKDWRDMHISEYHRAEPVETGDHMKVFEVPVEPQQTDAFYQTRSLWSWVPAKVGAEDDDFYFFPFRIDFTLTVTVSLDPDFDAGAA